MSYATKQNMIDRFGEREMIALSDRDEDGEIDDAVVDRALTAADEEIEAYLVGRVQLPFTSVPKIVTGFACDIARFRLTGAGVTRTEEIANDYNRAIKFFEQVQAGKVNLGLDVANQPVAETELVRFEKGSKIFGRDRGCDG